MENTEIGTDEGMDTGMDEGSEVIENEVDDSYDADYKDDFSVPTEASDEEVIEQQEEDEYSDQQFNDDILGYLRDNFELPEKFKDVGDIVNSYKHLESKLGSMVGAPETYELAEGIEDTFSEDMLTGITDAAREMGLNNEGMNKLLVAASEQSNREADANWEMEKNKIGKHADEELSQAASYLNANFSEEVSETLQSMVQTADQFAALKEAVMGNNPNSQSAPATNQNSSPQFTEESVNKMLYAKDDFGNSKMETDSNYAAKVMNMMKQIHG